MRRDRKPDPREQLEPSPAARREVWLGASLVVIAFALYAGALDDEYVFDGMSLVRDNGLLSPFEPLRIAGLDWWAGTGKPGGLYRPVSLVSLAALRALDGGGPGWINFANVALHGLVAWLHFVLLVRFLGPRPGAQLVAWLGALIALVHPLNAEVVGGQVGIADLLAAFCLSAAVLVADGTSRVRFAFGALLAALATLSKESGVLVVPLAVLFAAFRDSADPRPARRVARAVLWSSLGVAAALICRYRAISSLASADDPVYAGFSELARVASACATFATYSVPLLLAPWRQLAVVSHQDAPPAASFDDPRAIAGALLLVAGSIAPWFALRRGRRDIAFGVWFFLAAWMLTSNLFFSSGAIAASRFFYVGLIGLALPLAVFLVDAWARSGARRVAAASIAGWFFVVMPVVAWRETATWRTERTLLESQVAREPSSAYSLVDLATVIRDEDPARSAQLFSAAAASTVPSIPGQPFPPEDLLEALFLARLGVARIQESSGERDHAEQNYRAAEGLAESGRRARTVLPFREDWGKHRSFVLQRLAAGSLERAKTLSGDERTSALVDAQRDLDASDACDPDASEAVRLRSILLELRGDPLGRARLVEAAWKKRPEDHLLRILWANELRQQGRQTDALGIELDVALAIFDNFDPARSLAIAKEGLASSDAAIVARSRALLERLARLVPSRPASRSIALEAVQLLRGS